MKTTRKEIKLQNAKTNDIVFLSKTSKTPYEVVDVCCPCCMLLNTKTNFIVCYKCDILYTDSNIQ